MGNYQAFDIRRYSTFADGKARRHHKAFLDEGEMPQWRKDPRVRRSTSRHADRRGFAFAEPDDGLLRGIHQHGHCERKRSNPWRSKRKAGLLRGACHRARIRATRWLAMTARHDFAISPHAFFCARYSFIPALQTEGAGNAGRPMRPIAVCAMVVVERTHVVRSHRNHPAFPTQWFTDYTCAPRCSGFLVTVTPEKLSLPRNLTPASRCQDYTTSPSARKRPRLEHSLRPPHPAPR